MIYLGRLDVGFIIAGRGSLYMCTSDYEHKQIAWENLLVWMLSTVAEAIRTMGSLRTVSKSFCKWPG
eukprot:1517178-Amphidinium_carterae.2